MENTMRFINGMVRSVMLGSQKYSLARQVTSVLFCRLFALSACLTRASSVLGATRASPVLGATRAGPVLGASRAQPDWRQAAARGKRHSKERKNHNKPLRSFF